MSLETVADTRMTLDLIEERLAKVMFLFHASVDHANATQVLLDDALWMAKKLRGLLPAPVQPEAA